MSKESTKKGIDSRLLGRIVSYLMPYKGWVTLAFLTVMIAAFLGPLSPKLVQVTIDRDIVSGDMEGLRRMIGILFIVLAGEGILSFVNAYLTQWIGQQAIFDLRTKLYRHIQRQSLRFFDTRPIGQLITRVTSDVESLSQVLSAGVVTILGDLFKLIFIAWFMFSLDWRLALVTIAVMPIMIYATFWFKRKVRDAYRDTRKQVARLNSFMQEHVSGMRIVQLFGREEEEMNRFDDINNDHRQAHIRTIFYFALFWPMVDLVASAALGLVIWYGGLSAMTGGVTIGVLIAFIQYARRFFEPIRNLSDQFNLLQSAMAGAERIFGLLDTDESIPAPDEVTAWEKVDGRIEFRNVWFSYDPTAKPDDLEADWVLQDVSFVVNPGESLAIVGATGAGKTTIINLLLRFYEIQKGEIVVDGVNIRKLDLDNLRDHIGLVLQDVFLFSGSVRENVTLRNEDLGDERIRAAAEAIGASGFIDKLSDGFDQEVKERGMSLSHGQRQLLSFLRALVYDPRILVLDEATSSVDTETEEIIQKALETLMKGRTSIAIAHRLSTVQHADQILVMHRGQVRERGSHQQLIAAEGLYRKLYELQYKDQELAV
ncbi:MAG: ABC transporter ATP-binding protein [Bacteroidetes bacterium]|nr:ABC transporter ATP-binding protein [Bacteroidota bacterium]